MAGDIPFGKAGSRICEEILPFALECFVLVNISQSWIVFDEQVLSNVCLKPATPFTEGSRVVYEQDTAQGGSMKPCENILTRSVVLDSFESEPEIGRAHV